MRVFISVLILIFSLQSWGKADDIKDIEIEGMSIGDSALDFFSKIEIKNGKKDYGYKDETFYEVEIYNHDSFKQYENIQIALKKNDSKYKIKKVLGFNFISNDNNKCFEQVDIVFNEIKNLFINAKISHDLDDHPADPSGQSKTKVTYIKLDEGEIWLECYDWSTQLNKEKNWNDNFGVNLMSKEYLYWLRNKAY